MSLRTNEKSQKLCALLLTIVLTIFIAELDHFHKYASAVRYPVSYYTLSTFNDNPEAKSDFWLQKDKKFVVDKTNAKFNTKKAKNVILFVGSGMSLTTIAAARDLLGGAQAQLAFEKFPYTGLAMTYTVNTMVADSASAATAYLCGVKSQFGTIGLNGKVKRGNCAGMNNTSYQVHSIAKWAIDAGKSAGLVTTRSVTHSSAAGVYAHVADREWENDAALTADCGANSNLQDTAQQLINGEVGKQLKVILGGGKGHFIDSKIDEHGLRQDKRNLIEEYLKQARGNVFLDTQEDLHDFNAKTSERLLGLFNMSSLSYHMIKEETQPTLEEMTTRAIEMLQKRAKGYFLFVSSGHIDVAHLRNKAEYALDETVEFSKAVEAAHNMTSEEDTLIVVTADHSHSLTISGYQFRKYKVLDVARKEATDRREYLQLSYATGPAFRKYFNSERNKRFEPSIVRDKVENFPTITQTRCAKNGGEDVAVYASGPWAHLFSGVYGQHVIPHLMAYAACIGNGTTVC